MRHLLSVETFGSATVIASDKTGTLTKNEITVRSVITACGRVDFTGAVCSPSGEVKVAGGLILGGALQSELKRAPIIAHRANNAELNKNNGAWQVHSDPTEGALIAAALKVGFEGAGLAVRFARIGEIAFPSERRLISALPTDAE